MTQSVKLGAAERIILAVDTAQARDADRLTGIAQDSGARYVKFGLQALFALGLRDCAALAEGHGLEWVADAKLHDIPKTVASAVDNFADLGYPPFGITIHTSAGEAAMKLAQQRAGTIKMLGVTVLTSIQNGESLRIFRASAQTKALELAYDAARAGLKGVVASPLEIGAIKSDDQTQHLFAMIPSTRSFGVSHGDQERVATPGEAIRNGADLLVIGRQITGAENPTVAYASLVSEIDDALALGPLA